jgi:hypothetical protein
VDLEVPIGDDELAAEALAADPNVVVSDDCPSLWELTGAPVRQSLPEWYMPTPMRPPAVQGWRRVLVRWNVALIIAAFLTINAAGLCNTYGQLHL